MERPEDPDVFAAHLASKLAELEAPAPQGLAKWTPQFWSALAVFFAVLVVMAVFMPNRMFSVETRAITITLGTLGFWRYAWWLTHAVRAEVFLRCFPKTRARAEQVWERGWRPPHLHIQMTTFYEEPAITREVIGSILRQIKREGIPTTIWIGTGTNFDEDLIRDFVREKGGNVNGELVFLRQNQPGKRMAIGMILRAMNRAGIQDNDLVVFMDGDAVFGDGVLRNCCSLFGADPELQALTTDEEVLCYGPNWVERWLSMRFAQRRLAMQSHALSNRVLTLTGRMSMFRAQYIKSEKFIRTIEADHLDHWLWGRFRFLSGDDKSTWYHLLSKKAKMTYVRDACVYTIEEIKGSGMERMVQNFRRWSGNMLRNGSRAMALGPGHMPFFIWWCIVDQRLATWTMLVSPLAAIFTFHVDPMLVLHVFLWLLASRLSLCLFLFRHNRWTDLWWPFILYLNQLINAGVKVFMIFHISKQKWSNRGNQSSGETGGAWGVAQNLIAKAQMGIAILAFISAVGLASNFLLTV